MSSLSRWCDNIASLTAPVPCGEQEHRVTWRRGKLVLEDHDLSAERALLALGGKPCACLQVLKMWRDQWAMPPELFRQMPSWLGPNTFLAPPELGPARQLAVALNWHRTWRRSLYTTKHGRLLEEDLRRLASVPLGQHVARRAQRFGLSATPAVGVELSHAQPGPMLVGHIDDSGAWATARLDVNWLLRIWGPGVAVVGDGFVLEVVDDDATSTMAVRAARWVEDGATNGYRATVQRAQLDRVENGWTITWMDGA